MYDDWQQQDWQQQGGFHITGPPRFVPWTVRLRLLVGGFSNQFGWAFLGFGMIFVWVFGSMADVKSLTHFSGQLQTAQGVVTKSEETSAEENERRVYANYYTFLSEGVEYSGISYATGKKLSPGKTVTIEFPAGQPEVSRIAGMRSNLFSVWVLFVAIFPLVGVPFILWGLWKAYRGMHLLTYGIPAVGKLVDCTPTGSRVNKQPVYKYTFDFISDNGMTYQAHGYSHTDELKDEAEEPLLYDPANPHNAMMLDSLPGGPRIDELGEIRSTSGSVLIWLLVLPGLTVVGNGTVLWWMISS